MTTAISGSVHPELQYETIQSDTLARSSLTEYSAGNSFLYDNVALYKKFSFLDKTDELITQTINLEKPHRVAAAVREAF